MSKEETIRTFIAVTPDDVVLDVVEERVSALKQVLNAPEIRWESRAKWHVTLRFLGDVPSNSVEELRAAINESCHGRRTFPVCVEGIGAFPTMKRPRVLWVGVHAPDSALATLQESISEQTARFAEKADEKRFRPHLTIARIRPEHRRAASRVQSAVEPFSATHFGEWEVRKVELWRSILKPAGSQYELLDSFPLES